MHPWYVPIDAEVLRRLYVDERLTTDEIAVRLGCTGTTVLRRLRKLGIPARAKGPVPRRQEEGKLISWNREMAYAVGLIATDGNLARGSRQITVTSKDVDLLETVRRCLQLKTPISASRSGAGKLCHRLQWRDSVLYEWLLTIGLTPAKSLTLGRLAVPDEHFADFVRGCIDGDGSIKTYTDRYHVSKNPTYVYERLFVSLVSASQSFLEWVRASIARLNGVRGSLTVRTAGRPHPLWCLKYAKRESIRLLRWMYYSRTVPCLARKQLRAEPFLQTQCNGMLGAMVPGWRNGRLAALKTPCPQGRAGSNPAPGTIP